MKKQPWETSLADWYKNLQPEQSVRQEILSRIRYAVTEDNVYAAETVIQSNDLFWLKLRYAFAGAVIAAFVTFMHLSFTANPAPQLQSNGPAESFAAIPEKRMHFGYELFKSFEQQFAEKLRWVSTSSGYVGLGISEDSDSFPDANEPVMVRMVVVASHAGEEWWRPVWHADVILRGGEVVEVVPNDYAENRVKLLVYRRNDGLITIGTSLSLEEPLNLSTRDIRTVEINRPSVLNLPSDTNYDYKLLHAVRPLKNSSHQG